MDNNEFYIKYNNNEDIKSLIDVTLEQNGLKKTFVANNLGLSKAGFYSFLNKKNITLDDLKKIMDLDCLNYEIEVHLKRKQTKEENQNIQNDANLEVVENFIDELNEMNNNKKNKIATNILKSIIEALQEEHESTNMNPFNQQNNENNQ